jgi:hypothetical protein
MTRLHIKTKKTPQCINGEHKDFIKLFVSVRFKNYQLFVFLDDLNLELRLARLENLMDRRLLLLNR